MQASAYREARRELLGESSHGQLAARRRALADLTDHWLAGVFAESGAAEGGCALIAVGGYGRAELTPGSDLDLLLLVPERAESSIGETADRLWYPVWDSGVRVDHSVRTVPHARRMAASDLRVMLGLLDMRCVAGDGDLAARLQSSILGDWRGLARSRLPELRDAVDARRARHGDLADLIEPDLKESFGGLRDLTILRAVAASWVTDVPHQGLEAAHQQLLDVRDALHEGALSQERRPGDVLRLQDQDAVAERLAIGDADDLLRAVSESARVVAYAAEITWHRVGRLTRDSGLRPFLRRKRRSGPERTPLADGAVVYDGEVVLAAEARPDRDPVLVLRLAAAAAQAGLPISPAALHRLADESAPMPVPWPDDARDALVSLLGAGPALVPVWEALDHVGLIERLIPEWGPVRGAPQRNALHVYRVDRHLIEAAANAGERVRRVERPDLLLAGALLHDIGKGRPGDHTEVGMLLVADLAPRLGFDADDTAVLVSLVEHHLLLPEAATRRDLDDPMTIALVAEAVETRRTLDLLHALTESDALATGPAAWSDWKAALIDDLVARTRASLAGETVPGEPQVALAHADLIAAPGLQVRLAPGDAATRVIVAADDRPGLLADIAGVLALNRLQVRSADTQTVGDRAVSSWVVHPLYGDPPSQEQLRHDIDRALEGGLDVTAKLAARQQPARAGSAPARVDFVTGAASSDDVLEVRAHDEAGLLHRLGSAVTSAGAFITAARVATLGSEVIDVFYVRRPDGSRLDAADRARIVATVLDALAPGPH